MTQEDLKQIEDLLEEKLEQKFRENNTILKRELKLYIDNYVFPKTQLMVEKLIENIRSEINILKEEIRKVNETLSALSKRTDQDTQTVGIDVYMLKERVSTLSLELEQIKQQLAAKA